MAFNRLMLTTPGKTLYAKAQQGKTLHFSRVAIGDGSIGTGSLVNRTALISEKMSLAIDAVQIVNSTESAIVTSLSNSALAEGFYFREIGIFATDPDTSAEVLYLYDNAGTDGEFIPASSSGVTVSERLKFLLLLDNVTSVTFTASGNPIYLSTDDIQDGTVGSSVLWSSTYIDVQLKTNADAAAAKIPKSLATTVNQFLVSTAAGAWAVKTVAEIKVLLGLGSAAYTASTNYATAAQGAKADGAVPKSLGTEADQLLVSTGAGTWAVKTLAQIKTWLGLGSAAYTDSTAYAAAAHKSRHATGGADALTPSDIGAYTKSEIISDTTKNASGLPTTAIPDDVFNAITGGKVGDIVFSKRKDFKSKIGDVYLPCDGRILDDSNYPVLLNSVAKTPNLNQARAKTVPGASGWINRFFKTKSGKLLAKRDKLLLSSTDNGETWTSSNFTYEFSYPVQLSDNNIYLVSPWTNAISYDDGVSWSVYSTPAPSFYEYIAADNDRIIARSGDNKLYYSDDKYQTFTQITAITDAVDLVGVDGNFIYAAKKTEHYYWKSIDNGATWIKYTLNPTSYCIFILLPADGQLFAAVETNSGASYFKLARITNIVTILSNDSFTDVGAYATIQAVSNGGIYFSTDSGHIIYSNDQKTWTGKNISGFQHIHYLTECDNGKILFADGDAGVVGIIDAYLTLPDIPNFYMKVK